MIDFGVILDHVGDFGRYQVALCCMVFYLTVSCAMHILSPVFYAAPMDFRCRVLSIENLIVSKNFSDEFITNATSYFNHETSKYDGCQRLPLNLTSCNLTMECIMTNSTPISCVDGYHYDRTEFIETTVSEWNLVCDRHFLNTVEHSIFFVGAMAGGFVAGYLADRFGRKPALMCCCLGIIVFGSIASLVPWFPAFVVARFFVGMCAVGQDFLTQVYVIEITGRKRTTASILGQVAFGIGLFVNSFISYFVRNWRYFYLMLSLFNVPYIVFHYLIPESPRWYFSKSKNELGKKVAQRFGKYNKKKITPDIWREAEISLKDITDTSNEKYTFLDLFKPKKMRMITICINICWFVSFMTYIGLSLNVGSLAGNIFLNNAFNGVVSVVCSIFLIFTINRISRRFLLSGSMFLTAVASFGSFCAIIFGGDAPAAATTGRVLTFIAYLGSWIVIVVSFIYTAELYPTVIRSNAVGVATVSGSLGDIVAPIVISSKYLWLPSIVFGILSTVAGILFLQLPETINKPLPETFEEAELFYASRKPLRPFVSDVHTQQSTLLQQKEGNDDQLDKDVIDQQSC
uniref:organic cation transporter protein-like isoform X1 n=1 Tax=Styela clava TaxID=7725 RepID=UPI00193A2656|nr:organic cation transporter protein-like isoform X1 [Styela clava]